MHRVVMAVVAVVCVGQTVRDLLSPAPSATSWNDVLTHIVTGFVWSFFLLFFGTSAYVTSWEGATRGWRVFGYAVALFYSVVFALPLSLFASGNIGEPITRFQVARGNARRRAAITLRRWSYAFDGAGVMSGVADITAGTSGKFRLHVSANLGPFNLDSSDFSSEEIWLTKNAEATFKWRLVCPDAHSQSGSGAELGPDSLYFSITDGPRDRYGRQEDSNGVVFDRSRKEAEGDGHILHLPLPPPTNE
jgi:hypothetical protein